jgi:uncharacterized membrane protein YpjA
MKRVARELGFALMAWFVPFAVSVCVFPLRERDRPLFEVLMSFTLTVNTTLLGLIYSHRVTENRLRRAIGIGLTWMVANWLIDLAMFSRGPMQMPLRQYLHEIAGAYLVIPVITLGLGAAAKAGAHATFEVP